MRGLTPMEKRVLFGAVHSTGEVCVHGTPEHDAIMSLAGRGLISLERVETPVVMGGAKVTRHTRATDLGRLLLSLGESAVTA